MEIGQFRRSDVLHRIGSQEPKLHGSWKQIRHFISASYTVVGRTASVCRHRFRISVQRPDILRHLPISFTFEVKCCGSTLNYASTASLDIIFVPSKWVCCLLLIGLATSVTHLLPINCHVPFWKPRSISIELQPAEV